jgi:hypothetical protein
VGVQRNTIWTKLLTTIRFNITACVIVVLGGLCRVPFRPTDFQFFGNLVIYMTNFLVGGLDGLDVYNATLLLQAYVAIFNDGKILFP